MSGLDGMGWIYLRSLVLKEHRQSDANNIFFTQDAILVVNTGPSPCRPGNFNSEASKVKMICLVTMAAAAAG